MELVADRLWLAADGGVKPFDGDMDDYAKFVLDRARVAARAPTQVREADKPAVNTKAPIATGRDPVAAAGPLRRKLSAAEETLARATRTLAEIDAKLADPSIYVREPTAASDLAKRRERAQSQVDDAEAAWMAAAEALEAVAG
jgi:ATP-binding cassette subfamily F protein 3